MKTKVAFREQSNGVVAEVSVEGDEPKEVIEKQAEELYLTAQKFSNQQSMKKVK